MRSSPVDYSRDFIDTALDLVDITSGVGGRGLFSAGCCATGLTMLVINGLY